MDKYKMIRWVASLKCLHVDIFPAETRASSADDDDNNNSLVSGSFPLLTSLHLNFPPSADHWAGRVGLPQTLRPTHQNITADRIAIIDLLVALIITGWT